MRRPTAIYAPDGSIIDTIDLLVWLPAPPRTAVRPWVDATTYPSLDVVHPTWL